MFDNAVVTQLQLFDIGVGDGMGWRAACGFRARERIPVLRVDSTVVAAILAQAMG